MQECGNETDCKSSMCREKFHALDRNNFRSKDWGEVAKAVNARCGNEKTPKTQEQCRMKVDSLKKRYRQVLFLGKPYLSCRVLIQY